LRARERRGDLPALGETTCVAPPLRVRVLHRLLGCQGPDIDGVYAARAAAADPATHRIAPGCSTS